MIIAQTILIFPIITSFIITHLLGKIDKIKETAMVLGASPLQLLWTIIQETRLGIIGAVAGGFARAIGEVGAAMMVGGNIKHFTRVMTTAIALETSKGEFEMAMSLGVVLLLISLGSLVWSVRLHKRWWVLVVGATGAFGIYAGRYIWFRPLLMYTGAFLLIGISIVNFKLKISCRCKQC